MNIDTSAFSNLASKKRKRWQYVADEVASGKKNSCLIGHFIASVWNIARLQSRPGGRKTIRFHDLWHTLNDIEPEQSSSTDDIMVDYS